MKKRIFLGVILCILSSLALSQTADPLAQRHIAKGMSCSSCHLTDKPEPFAEVPAKNCNQCHPQNVIVDKFAFMGDRNPHKNHLGEVDCNICHVGHQAPVSYCAQCHSNFTHKLK